MNRTTPQVNYQILLSDGASGFRQLKLTEIRDNPFECPDLSCLFDVDVHSEQTSNSENMQYPITSLTLQAKRSVSWMGFNSQPYYQAWNKFCENHGISDVTENAQLKKNILVLQFGTIILRALSNLQM